MTTTKPPTGFWVVSILALLWNLVGVFTYLSSVTMGPETLAQLPDAERALYSDIPVWATSAYAVGVFGGTLGCLALLLRKAWALQALVASLLGILVQMSHALMMTQLLMVRGGGAAVLPAVIIVVALLLVVFAIAAKRNGWLT